MKHAFKIGDRVAGDHYDPSKGKFTRVKGYYGGVPADKTDIVLVAFHSGGHSGWSCAPNSIRLLTKKERKRCWVRWADRGPFDVRTTDMSSDAYAGWVEMVEVRSKTK